jgi:hypothetical protein
MAKCRQLQEMASYILILGPSFHDEIFLGSSFHDEIFLPASIAVLKY